VLGYLNADSISALPFQRLAGADTARASQLFQHLLKKPGFSWERDGEALLRKHKPWCFGVEPHPPVTPLSSELAEALPSSSQQPLGPPGRPLRRVPRRSLAKIYAHCFDGPAAATSGLPTPSVLRTPRPSRNPMTREMTTSSRHLEMPGQRRKAGRAVSVTVPTSAVRGRGAARRAPPAMARLPLAVPGDTRGVRLDYHIS
jgi:hypothetical protein